MPISTDQENQLANARSTSRKFGQDKTHPFLINIDDGRLMPNTPHLLKQRGNKYRVYTGDPKASLDERLSYLKSGVGPKRTRVINTKEPEPFDIGTASKEDLVAFAAAEYGVTLDSNKSLKVLRAEFAKTAEALSGEDLS